MKTNIDAAKIADKHFGQNFLKDHTYVEQIIQAMPDDDLPVVEIGPGLGDLTSELLRVRSVTAFEVDKRLCEHLRETFALPIESGAMRLVCGDALEHWEQKSLVDTPYHLVANLPYYIATRLVLKALHDPMCQSVLVMVQKEVALKFAARPGERDFSALSVLAASAGEARLRFEVPPEAFVPPPKVTSAVLAIRKDRTLEDPAFERFLQAAFGQPRKKLAKNLERHFAKETVRLAFETLELAPLLRPHEATTSIYHRLYTTLKKEFHDGQEHTQPTKRTRRSARRTPTT
jgi:16S rRNA (adenine1518-N6/adenine1519-N6)-dimethyltransferase